MLARFITEDEQHLAFCGMNGLALQRDGKNLVDTIFRAAVIGHMRDLNFLGNPLTAGERAFDDFNDAPVGHAFHEPAPHRLCHGREKILRAEIDEDHSHVAVNDEQAVIDAIHQTVEKFRAPLDAPEKFSIFDFLLLNLYTDGPHLAALAPPGMGKARSRKHAGDQKNGHGR